MTDPKTKVVKLGKKISNGIIIWIGLFSTKDSKTLLNMFYYNYD